VAGVGFGHRERDVQLAADRARQIAALELLAPVLDQGHQAEHPQVDRAGSVHGAGVRHFTHQQSGLGHAQTAPAVLLRDRDAEITRIGNRFVEIVRELVALVVAAPIFVGEALAQRADAVYDFILRVGQIEIHAIFLKTWANFGPPNYYLSQGRCSKRSPPMTSLSAALILTLLLLGPLAVQALERNLEAYCLILGLIAVTLSGQWNRPLLAQMASAPVPITLAVVVAGLAFARFRP